MTPLRDLVHLKVELPVPGVEAPFSYAPDAVCSVTRVTPAAEAGAGDAARSSGDTLGTPALAAQDGVAGAAPFLREWVPLCDAHPSPSDVRGAPAAGGRSLVECDAPATTGKTSAHARTLARVLLVETAGGGACLFDALHKHTQNMLAFLRASAEPTDGIASPGWTMVTRMA